MVSKFNLQKQYWSYVCDLVYFSPIYWSAFIVRTVYAQHYRCNSALLISCERLWLAHEISPTPQLAHIRYMTLYRVCHSQTDSITVAAHVMLLHIEHLYLSPPWCLQNYTRFIDVDASPDGKSPVWLWGFKSSLQSIKQAQFAFSL